MRKIREHIPLDQGLRLCQSLVYRILKLIREHIPLEQGLRLISATSFIIFLLKSESIFH